MIKTLLTVLVAGFAVLFHTGCAARATVGNHDQHGVGVSAKAHGPERGVNAKVY